MAHPDLAIDEYLRERLMPVEGPIPHIPGIEMFGNSIPARPICVWPLPLSGTGSPDTSDLSDSRCGDAPEKLFIPRDIARPRLWHAICVCNGWNV